MQSPLASPYFPSCPENSSLFMNHHNPVQAQHWEESHQYGLLTPPFEESPYRHQHPEPSHYQQEQYRTPRFIPVHHHQEHYRSNQSPFPSPSNSPCPTPRFNSPPRFQSNLTQQEEQHLYQQQQLHLQQHLQQHHYQQEHQQQYEAEQAQYYRSQQESTPYYSPIHNVSPSYTESPYENRQPPREDSEDLPEHGAYRIDRPGNPCKPFIAKLAHLLQHPEIYADVVHWNSQGTSFVIALNENFIQSVLPEVFSHSSLVAFKRQLNTYGFKHLSNAQLQSEFLPFRDPNISLRDLAAWSHPFFSKDDPSNLNKLLPRQSKARKAHQTYKLSMMLEGRSGISLRTKNEEKKRRNLMSTLKECQSPSSSAAEILTESYLRT